MTLLSAKPTMTQSAVAADDDLSLSSPAGISHDAKPTAAALATADSGAAANDDAATPEDPARNPLWVIAIGMACLFGTMAAVMSIS
jgi:hypothetical protein